MNFKKLYAFVIIPFLSAFNTSDCYSIDEANSDNSSSKPVNKKEMVLADPFVYLRSQSLNLSPDQLPVKYLEEDKLYGIVMDYYLEDTIVTVISLLTGDASAYFSTGHAYIGGYKYELVRTAANEFLDIGNKVLSKAIKTENLQLTDHADFPQKEKVNFFFLTNSGKYLIQEDLDFIKSHKSNLKRLFDAANQVIIEYKKVSQLR